MDVEQMIVQDCMPAMADVVSGEVTRPERWTSGNIYDWLHETPAARKVPALQRVALVAAYGMPARVFVSDVAALREMFGEDGSVWTTEATETEPGAWYIVNVDGTRVGICEVNNE